jgi:hypothetical protein
MLELDVVVRQNQLACLPFAKSGRAEAELLDRYPELTSSMERSKQVKIDSMALRSRLHEDEVKVTRQPSLKPSTNDLMFDMEEDQGAKDNTRRGSTTPHASPCIAPQSPPSMPQDMWYDSRGKALSPVSPRMLAQSQKSLGASSASLSRTFELPSSMQLPPAKSSPSIKQNPLWNAQPLKSTKLDMKTIMAQADETRKSNISSGLSQSSAGYSAIKATPMKMSQKDRKKQQQQQQLAQASSPASPSLRPTSGHSNASPWRVASSGSKVNLKDVLQSPQLSPATKPSQKRRPSPGPSLTMRQTVPGNATTVRKTSLEPPLPKPPVSAQSRSLSSPVIRSHIYSTSSPKPVPHPLPLQGPSLSPSPSVPIRSIRHEPRAVEPSLQLSMADILAQQQIEKDVIKEATAKKSLQEIQEEQAFQEWWDQEAALTKARMEEEAAAAAVGASASDKRSGKSGRGGKSNRGRGGGRGGTVIRGGFRGGKGKGEVDGGGKVGRSEASKA